MPMDEKVLFRMVTQFYIMSDYEKTLDIIFGRWRSQILYVGVKLGIFDCITSDPKNTSDIAKELGT